MQSFFPIPTIADGTHGKTFLADLQLVRTDGTNGKKIRADLPLVRTDGTNEKIFLTISVPAVQNGKIFSIFAQK